MGVYVFVSHVFPQRAEVHGPEKSEQTRANGHDIECSSRPILVRTRMVVFSLLGCLETVFACDYTP